MRSKRRTQYTGNIESVRAVEDCIRVTRKYTEGIGTISHSHPEPMQGREFPSSVFMKYYEVYPDVEVTWDMPAGIALEWLTGKRKAIDVTFKYNYLWNKASVAVKDGIDGLNILKQSIPGFAQALYKVKDEGKVEL